MTRKRLTQDVSQAKRAAQVFIDGEELERDELQTFRFDGARVLIFEISGLGRRTRCG